MRTIECSQFCNNYDSCERCYNNDMFELDESAVPELLKNALTNNCNAFCRGISCKLCTKCDRFESAPWSPSWLQNLEGSTYEKLQTAKEEGDSEGYERGYEKGKAEGYDDGFASGKEEGLETSKESYDDGYKDGYDEATKDLS